MYIVFTISTCRLSQLISIFVSVWLTAAGIIHLVSHVVVFEPFFVVVEIVFVCLCYFSSMFLARE